jgi:hypothetical protein
MPTHDGSGVSRLDYNIAVVALVNIAIIIEL